MPGLTLPCTFIETHGKSLTKQKYLQSSRDWVLLVAVVRNDYQVLQVYLYVCLNEESWKHVQVFSDDNISLSYFNKLIRTCPLHSVRLVVGFLLDSLMLNVDCSSSEPSRRGKLQRFSQTENKTPHLIIRRPVDTTSYDETLKQDSTYIQYEYSYKNLMRIGYMWCLLKIPISSNNGFFELPDYSNHKTSFPSSPQWNIVILPLISRTIRFFKRILRFAWMVWEIGTPL